MICYKPVFTKDELLLLYPDFTFEDDVIYGGYKGFEEDGTSVGKCLFSINGYNCSIISIDCDYSDKLLIEGYIRSALNFCANRNAYMAFCEIDVVSDVLTMLGFEKKDGIYYGDIPTLLKGSCCK